MEYRLSGILTERETIKLFRRHNLKLYIMLWSFVCLVLVLGILLGKYIWILYVAIYALFIEGILWYQARKNYRKNKIIQLPQKFTINENFILSESARGNIQFDKNLLTKIKYYNDAIYLFLLDNTANTLQKSWLENGEWTEFVAFMKKYYGM